jgi:protein PET117
MTKILGTDNLLQTMYQGVLRDDERKREKMRQRQAELEESRKKREIFERVQDVQKNEGE